MGAKHNVYSSDELGRPSGLKRIHIVDSRVLIMGVTFKENCPDVRNTRVVDIIDAFNQYHSSIDVWDPWVSDDDGQRLSSRYGLNFIKQPDAGSYDAIVLCVAHREFVALKPEEVRAFGKEKSVVYDVKGIFQAEEVDSRL